jgi:ribosomal protein L7Ae-like RNA K-turn-binding protein
MELSLLRHVYDQEGPFATVYLEGRSPSEDAGTQTRLRWQALREQLLSDGAPEDIVQAIENELGQATAGEEQGNGRVLVANSSGVLLNEPFDAAQGAGDSVHYTALPELGPHARERAREIRELVVVASQEGATVRQEIVLQQHEPRKVATGDVHGSAVEGVHKPRGQALSHKQIQRRADEAVLRNAKDVVQHVSEAVDRFHPDVIVLAGEVQARSAVRGQLPLELADITVETERGGRDSNASDDSLTEQLLQIAEEKSAARAEQAVDKFKSGLAHGLAVTGSQSVRHAAERGAVETLLLEEDAPASTESQLLKACADTDAEVTLVPSGTELTDGVGALLRFPIT